MIDIHDLIDCEYHMGPEEEAYDNAYMEFLEYSEFEAFWSWVKCVYIPQIPQEEAADAAAEKDFELGPPNEW